MSNRDFPFLLCDLIALDRMATLLEMAAEALEADICPGNGHARWTADRITTAAVAIEAARQLAREVLGPELADSAITDDLQTHLATAAASIKTAGRRLPPQIPPQLPPQVPPQLPPPLPPVHDPGTIRSEGWPRDPGTIRSEGWPRGDRDERSPN
jgi:hypothetical protein